MAKNSKRTATKRQELLVDEESATEFAEDSGQGERDEVILYASIKKPARFEILVDRYREAFIRKVRSILGNRNEVEDIVQEAFVKIYLNAGRFQVQKGASFKSWAYKILLNTTFTYYQKLKKDDGATVVLEREFYESLPDDDTGSTEMRDLIASVVSRMPQQLGRVLKLHFLDGMPQKEIAALEGVSVSAVKTRVHRAKREYKKISSRINN